MKEWHVEHMQKTILKYVTGLSPDASAWERRNHKKYGGLANMSRQIEYDIKQGATKEQALSMFSQIRSNESFSSLLKDAGAMERLSEVEGHFTKPRFERATWY